MSFGELGSDSNALKVYSPTRFASNYRGQSLNTSEQNVSILDAPVSATGSLSHEGLPALVPTKAPVPGASLSVAKSVKNIVSPTLVPSSLSRKGTVSLSKEPRALNPDPVSLNIDNNTGIVSHEIHKMDSSDGSNTNSFSDSPNYTTSESDLSDYDTDTKYDNPFSDDARVPSMFPYQLEAAAATLFPSEPSAKLPKAHEDVSQASLKKSLPLSSPSSQTRLKSVTRQSSMNLPQNQYKHSKKPSTPSSSSSQPKPCQVLGPPIDFAPAALKAEPVEFSDISTPTMEPTGLRSNNTSTCASTSSDNTFTDLVKVPSSRAHSRSTSISYLGLDSSARLQFIASLNGNNSMNPASQSNLVNTPSHSISSSQSSNSLKSKLNTDQLSFVKKSRRRSRSVGNDIFRQHKASFSASSITPNPTQSSVSLTTTPLGISLNTATKDVSALKPKTPPPRKSSSTPNSVAPLSIKKKPVTPIPVQKRRAQPPNLTCIDTQRANRAYLESGDAPQIVAGPLTGDIHTPGLKKSNDNSIHRARSQGAIRPPRTESADYDFSSLRGVVSGSMNETFKSQIERGESKLGVHNHRQNNSVPAADAVAVLQGLDSTEHKPTSKHYRKYSAPSSRPSNTHFASKSVSQIVGYGQSHQLTSSASLPSSPTSSMTVQNSNLHSPESTIDGFPYSTNSTRTKPCVTVQTSFPNQSLGRELNPLRPATGSLMEDVRLAATLAGPPRRTAHPPGLWQDYITNPTASISMPAGGIPTCQFIDVHSKY